eukprot:TRINITY_DN6341_c0_g1_i1.p1 TRINITY_DN6341_c0_g1~~TRINITY_DN6341_c0_g1_i1.p1  ORF type:complete len:515 (+),score=37.37 TRINITY_DN6341_c0_g1_i1:103-1647(+)
MLSHPKSCFCRYSHHGLGNRNNIQLHTLQRSSHLKICRKKRVEFVVRVFDNSEQPMKRKKKSNKQDDKQSINKLLQIGNEARPMGQPKDSIYAVDPLQDRDYQNNLFNAHHSFFVIDPQRSYLNQHITLVETRFRNRHLLARLVSQLLHRRLYSQEGCLREFPTYVVKALLQFHPSVEEKKLHDIVRIFTSAPPPPHPKEKRCFWVERSDGSKEDVSYRKCITQQTTEHGTFIRAAKFQILTLYNDYRKSLFKPGYPVYCAKTGVLLPDESECIVMCRDDPFEYVISQFVHRFRIDVSSVQYIIQTNKENKKTLLISSAGLRMQLERYFRENVPLCVVHKWFFVKQLNQVQLYCTDTQFEALVQMDKWQAFGKIKHFRQSDWNYIDGDEEDRIRYNDRFGKQRPNFVKTENKNDKQVQQQQQQQYKQQQKKQKNRQKRQKQLRSNDNLSSSIKQGNSFGKEQLPEQAKSLQKSREKQKQVVSALKQIRGVNNEQQEQKQQKQQQQYQQLDQDKS